MKAVKITDKIYWVGAIDWDVRNFHGYLTKRGSSYNAYLIIDEKVTLIDTVKSEFHQEMLTRIADVIEPSKIDYIVSNHVEKDHSGSLPKIRKLLKKVKIFTSPKGKEGLRAYYNCNDWDLQVINPQKPLNLGAYTLNFILTPMVHWPDNMVSYLPEEKLLFSNDAFGQHYASTERFAQKLPLDIIMEEAKKYYANIVMPYGNQVKRVLTNVANKNLEFNYIAPSHGVIWQENITDILDKYQQWSANQQQNKALIVYDTMWKSTEKIAYTLQDVFTAKGIKTIMYNLKVNHISDIMPDVLDAEYICVGSPTLNNNILPTVASFLTYLKGLSIGNKKGIAFGSYGWSGESIGQVSEMLKAAKCEVIEEIRVKYLPEEDLIKKINI